MRIFIDDWMKRLREKSSDSKMMSWETRIQGEGKQREAMLVDVLVSQRLYTCSHHTCFYKGGNWHSERLSNEPKVTLLISGRAGIYTQVCLVLKPKISPLNKHATYPTELAEGSIASGDGLGHRLLLSTWVLP